MGSRTQLKFQYSIPEQWESSERCEHSGVAFEEDPSGGEKLDNHWRHLGYTEAVPNEERRREW